MITVIDYGMGNLGSIKNMLKRINVPSQVTGDAEVISKAEKILLPGVGAFDAAMERIESSGLREVLDYKALVEKIPVIGVCLGMQLLTRKSEEGKRPGLGWIAADTKKFIFSTNTLKIPHMGWNLVHLKKESPLIKDLPEEPRFYFVHSFFVQCDDPGDVLTTTHYGSDFHSIIQHDNIYGAQFHPEKSHKYGMKLLENFSIL
jgi:imidazole glycerol-phosphate synthase subunit HisH